MIKKPMLAQKMEDWSKIKYPVFATPKLDGIRCLMINGKALTRKFKNIPNKSIADYLESKFVDGLDGEIIIPNKSFNEIQSLVMSEDGCPDFQYWIFDYVIDDKSKSYLDRMRDLEIYSRKNKDNKAIYLLPKRIDDEDELKKYENQCLKEGFEGIMIRSGNGPYKEGRSTVREGYLLKIKRFVDAEGIIIGFEEKMHNENEAEIDELGHTKRSSKKANLKPANTLGALILKDIKTNAQFSVGTGFDDNLRKEIWNNKEKYLNKIVTYKSQPYGKKELPRCPVFKGFRSEDDL